MSSIHNLRFFLEQADVCSFGKRAQKKLEFLLDSVTIDDTENATPADIEFIVSRIQEIKNVATERCEDKKEQLPILENERAKLPHGCDHYDPSTKTEATSFNDRAEAILNVLKEIFSMTLCVRARDRSSSSSSSVSTDADTVVKIVTVIHKYDKEHEGISVARQMATLFKQRTYDYVHKQKTELKRQDAVLLKAHETTTNELVTIKRHYFAAVATKEQTNDKIRVNRNLRTQQTGAAEKAKGMQFGFASHATVEQARVARELCQVNNQRSHSSLSLAIVEGYLHTLKKPEAEYIFLGDGITVETLLSYYTSERDRLKEEGTIPEEDSDSEEDEWEANLSASLLRA